MSAPNWEFAIDVGGTFTDCLGHSPEGQLQRHKLLSSGITKGTVGQGSTNTQIVDPARCVDPPDFWVGFRWTLLDAQGNKVATNNVLAFDHRTGTLELSDPIIAITQGAAYELSCSLEAPIIGIRYLLGLPLAVQVPPVQLRLGTTRGTNALLTRTGAKTALVTTQGFGDLLDIGYQDRPKLFELTVRKPKPLVDTSIEITERVAADGEVLIPFDEAQTKAALSKLHEQGIESLAICLMHADLFPAHERQVAEIARQIGFAEVSCSSEVAPLVKIVARAETTVVDAYLRPVLREYLAQLEASLPGSQIRLMTSAGGLVAPRDFRGHESVLSGPAGGVVGYSQAAIRTGFQRAIGFDMGGTSTDVSRFDGEFELEFETCKAGVRLIAPTLAIDTVAAGGGSICHFDGTKLTVGPDSAGADPGPACYGRGGPLTVTDLNYFLGRIVVERFPFELNHAAVVTRLEILANDVRKTTGEQLTLEQLAEGLLQIANANMARAVRGISVAKGANPEDYLLVAFGGAAAQHACAVARELGIRKILIHPDAGILSAYGISRADISRHAVMGIAQSLKAIDEPTLMNCFEELSVEPVQQVRDAGCEEHQLEVQRSLDVRYVGTDAALNVPFAALDEVSTQFQQQHQQLFGYTQPNREIEVVAARVQVVGKVAHNEAPSTSCEPTDFVTGRTSNFFFEGKQIAVMTFDRESLAPGARISGPAIIANQHSTVVIEPDWSAEMLSADELLLSDMADSVSSQSMTIASDAVKLEVFNNLFAGAAEQMGYVLRRTASSVNVKERLDYSCAVFTATGEMVANAPHVPVHLGAMGATVRSILAERSTIAEGDVYVTNDPYRGGSHLPDVTVITPVHHSDTGQLLFFTASRAHHAEIGGVRPGSMPPNSQTLGEEGVLISNFALIDQGISHEDKLRELLISEPYPSRRVEENLADLRAQVAANRQGARDLLALVAKYTLPVVEAQMLGIQHAAEQKVRQALSKLGLETCTFTDYLENAAGESMPISVKLTFHDQLAHRTQPHSPAVSIDFHGTAPVDRGNLNANPAIVTAAVLYVLRLLVDEEIPLNEGALRAVELIIPAGLLNPPQGDAPENSPAVAAGNVETSQRIVDVLLGALGIAGASQGTMNNVLFGDEAFGYYETIAGGAGATAEGPGADAVQVHMTNTRSTDPEILERRLPVRLWEFSIRRNSGGEGKHRGGHGVVRRLEFLEPLELSLITSRRGPHAPYGVAGGSPGALGENWLQRANGIWSRLSGIHQLNVDSRDRLVLKTPGGAGFGSCDS